VRTIHRLITGLTGISCVFALGCTQVHQLGQVIGGAEDADDTSGVDGATSSMAGEDSSSSTSTGDTESSSTASDTSETGDTGDSGDTTDTGETGGPIPAPCELADLGGTEGLSLEIMLMTEWNDGACHEVYVTNDTPDDVIWYRDLRFGGTLDNAWNANSEELSPTDWRFEGQATADNIVVLSGETILFGTCMLCTP
jgi:cellulase/cellobiase CelA1